MKKGRHLKHYSSRDNKISFLQQLFQTNLLPLPLSKITDYDCIRVYFQKMMDIEGFKNLWQTGEDPPESV